MAHCFFDTCALKFRYADGPYRATVNRIIGNRYNTSYIADLTILEMASAFGSHCRTASLTLAAYDLMDLRFMDDVARKRFIVRPTNKLNVLRARNLLRLGGMIHRRSMGSGDALIATCSIDLAQELKERIHFYTADWRLYSILRQIDAFTSSMTLHYLLPTKDSLIPTTT
jgi:hypothetical protein